MTGKIRSIDINFESNAVTEAPGGAKIGEKALVDWAEFENLGDIGIARMDKGLQLIHGPHSVWVLFVVLQGRVELQSPAQETRVYAAGSSFFLEPGTPHTETALDDNSVVLTVAGHSPDPDALGDYHMKTAALR